MKDIIIGRATCRECGATVVAEVEEDVECLECGRVFQIPNLPQYTQAFLHSMRSTSVARLGVGLGINRLLNTIPSESAEETHCWEIPKAARQKTHQQKIQVPLFPVFPEREEAQMFQEEKWLWVIAEYPGHNKIEQIRIDVRGKTLVLQSTLSLCPYKDTIEGLGLFINIFERNLRNGILEIKLKK
ncbi:MAG: hypothetical protein AAB842_00470 [Patescibacteria group bacterium]